MRTSRQSRITQTHPYPPPHIWMPTGNRPGPHSRGLKSTAVNHHKSKAASNIPLTHWQTNVSSNPPLQEQELLQTEVPHLTECLLEAVWGKWRHARLTNQLGRVVVSRCNTADRRIILLGCCNVKWDIYTEGDFSNGCHCRCLTNVLSVYVERRISPFLILFVCFV